MKITDEHILGVLRKCTARASATYICNALGIARNSRTGRYSGTAYKQYDAVGRALQRLKRAGKVEYVGGSGAGWRIARRV